MGKGGAVLVMRPSLQLPSEDELRRLVSYSLIYALHLFTRYVGCGNARNYYHSYFVSAYQFLTLLHCVSNRIVR
jgi:hypothetical protein